MTPGADEQDFLDSLHYFHWPVVWIGSSPVVDDEVEVGRLGETVWRETLGSGVEAKASCDGMFSFGLSGWASGRYLTPRERMQPGGTAGYDLAEVRAQRIKLLNAHLACLYTVLWRLQDSTPKRMLVSPDDLVIMKRFDDDSEHITSDERFQSLMEARDPAWIRDWSPPTELDWRFSQRVMVVEVETVEESFALLDEVLSHPDEDALTLVALYARAAKHHEERNYDVCLINSWAIIERLLSQLWEEYIEENRRREVDGQDVAFINRDRKRGLQENPNFTASVVGEVLSLVGVLPLDLYEAISALRKARNGWIHKLASVDYESSASAIRTAEAMLARVLGLKFAVPLRQGQRYGENQEQDPGASGEQR